MFTNPRVALGERVRRLVLLICMNLVLDQQQRLVNGAQVSNRFLSISISTSFLLASTITLAPIIALLSYVAFQVIVRLGPLWEGLGWLSGYALSSLSFLAAESVVKAGNATLGEALRDNLFDLFRGQPAGHF